MKRSSTAIAAATAAASGAAWLASSIPLFPRDRRHAWHRRIGMQRAVDLLDRTALGLDAEEQIDRAREHEPGCQIEEGGHDVLDARIRLDDVAAADHQRQP